MIILFLMCVRLFDARSTDLGHLFSLRLVLFWTLVYVLFVIKKTRRCIVIYYILNYQAEEAHKVLRHQLDRSSIN